MTEPQTLPKVISVPFYEDPLEIVKYEGDPFIAMKPIVENIGLRWNGQHAKLVANKIVWGIQVIWIPSKGGSQETLVMPLENLPFYLATIKPNKVSRHLREKIIRYQKECAKALWDYWTQGYAEKTMKPVPYRETDGWKKECYLRERIDLLQYNLLLAKTRWRRIFEYRSIGLPEKDIARLLGLSLGKLASISFEMERSGVLLPRKRFCPGIEVVYPETLLVEDKTNV